MTADSHSRALQQQTLTATTFVEIVDILVNDFDVIDVLTQLTARCVGLLHAKAAGILLADSSGHLCVVGASSEQIQLLELFQLQNDEGPCLDCYTSGKAIAAPDLTTPSAWPKFAAASIAAGYPSVYAIPLHHNNVILGCLNLFMTSSGPLAPTEIALAQALADVASIAIVQSHANQQTEANGGHLHHALDSRIAIEQAKGMVAEQFKLDVHDAFEILRSHARANHRSLTATAHQLVAGTIAIADFDPHTVSLQSRELVVETTVEGRRRIVRIAGELDLATKLECFNACVIGDSDAVEIDISGITFMDCSGYGALVAARNTLEQRGATLTVRDASGQPAHLLALLAGTENANRAADGSNRAPRHPPPQHTPAPLAEQADPPAPGPTPPHTAAPRSIRQRLAQLIQPTKRRQTNAPSPKRTHDERPAIMQISQPHRPSPNAATINPARTTKG